MAMATTVRVRAAAHKALKEMSKSRGVPIAQLVEEAVERLQREEFFRQGNEAYARLREDPKAWAELLAERAEWDCTLMDGLEDEPPWED